MTKDVQMCFDGVQINLAGALPITTVPGGRGLVDQQQQPPLQIALDDRHAEEIFAGQTLRRFSVPKQQGKGPGLICQFAAASDGTATLNDDALLSAVLTTPTGQAFVLAAVADGVGSNSYRHSGRGARIAVHVAHQVLSDLMHSGDPKIQLAVSALCEARDGSEAAHALGREVLPMIEAAFREHAALDHAKMKTLPGPESRLTGTLFSPYSTTLLVALAGPAGAIVLQIGDGGFAVMRGPIVEYVSGLDGCDAPTAALSLRTKQAATIGTATFVPLAPGMRLLLATDGPEKEVAIPDGALNKAPMTASLIDQLLDGRCLASPGDDMSAVEIIPPASQSAGHLPTRLVIRMGRAKENPSGGLVIRGMCKQTV